MRIPNRILITAVPGIGDALLATPLVSSLQEAYPHAQIDMLVRAGSEGILAGNPDINKIITLPKRPKIKDFLSFIWSNFRRYDLAISTSPTDRAFSNCLVASKRRLTIAPKKSFQTLWKYLLAEHTIEQDDTTHVIDQNLKLIDALGIKRNYRISATFQQDFNAELAKLLPVNFFQNPYLVVHVMPGSDYKVWPTEYWIKVLDYLVSNNYQIVLTGGNGEKELKICAELSSYHPAVVHNLCGKLSFGAVNKLIHHANAYLGTDTSTTHLAAATGTLTFAIYGPSNIRKWSPWPEGYSDPQPPFIEKVGTSRNGNVVVIRANCLCENFSRTCSKTSVPESKCLIEMSAEIVISALDEHFVKQAKTGNSADRFLQH